MGLLSVLSPAKGRDRTEIKAFQAGNAAILVDLGPAQVRDGPIGADRDTKGTSRAF
jgi:hypothetical protein